MSRRGSRSAAFIGGIKNRTGRSGGSLKKFNPGGAIKQIKQNKYLILKWKKEIEGLKKKSTLNEVSPDTITDEIAALEYKIKYFEKGNVRIKQKIEDQKIKMAEKRRRKAERKKTEPTKKIVHRIQSDI